MVINIFRSTEKEEFEKLIKVKLKEVMMMVDLEEVTSKTVSVHVIHGKET